MKENIKFLAVASPGGHLTELMSIISSSKYYTSFKVAVCDCVDNHVDGISVIHVMNLKKNLFFLLNLVEAFVVIMKNKPSLILSTGGGVAIPFFVVGRILRIKCVYIESPTRIETLSKTAIISTKIANLVILRHFNKSVSSNNVVSL